MYVLYNRINNGKFNIFFVSIKLHNHFFFLCNSGTIFYTLFYTIRHKCTIYYHKLLILKTVVLYNYN